MSELHGRPEYRPADASQGGHDQELLDPAVRTGRKLGKADVYVLTSAYTFSGAEEFAYNIKQLKRATLLEETPAWKVSRHPVVFRAAHVLLTYSCKFPCREFGRGL
jgi:hypothetical protein